MQPRVLTSELSVSSQIHPDDVNTLAANGFRSLICNRPNGESAEQPSFQEIECKAALLGLQVHYLPVESGKVSEEQAQAFGLLLDSLPKPVLAYCRTGTRSATLWALSQTSWTVPDILQRAAEAGYDLKSALGQAASRNR